MCKLLPFADIDNDIPAFNDIVRSECSNAPPKLTQVMKMMQKCMFYYITTTTFI